MRHKCQRLVIYVSAIAQCTRQHVGSDIIVWLKNFAFFRFYFYGCAHCEGRYRITLLFSLAVILKSVFSLVSTISIPSSSHVTTPRLQRETCQSIVHHHPWWRPWQSVFVNVCRVFARSGLGCRYNTSPGRAVVSGLFRAPLPLAVWCASFLCVCVKVGLAWFIGP